MAATYTQRPCGNTALVTIWRVVAILVIQVPLHLSAGRVPRKDDVVSPKGHAEIDDARIICVNVIGLDPGLNRKGAAKSERRKLDIAARAVECHAALRGRRVATVVQDPVAHDAVANRAIVGHQHSGNVARDQISGASYCPADGVIVGASANRDPDVVGPRMRAGWVGADEIRLDRVAGRRGSGNRDCRTVGEAFDRKSTDRRAGTVDRQAVTPGRLPVQFDERTARIARL